MTKFGPLVWAIALGSNPGLPVGLSPSSQLILSADIGLDPVAHLCLGVVDAETDEQSDVAKITRNLPTTPSVVS